MFTFLAQGPRPRPSEGPGDATLKVGCLIRAPEWLNDREAALPTQGPKGEIVHDNVQAGFVCFFGGG